MNLDFEERDYKLAKKHAKLEELREKAKKHDDKQKEKYERELKKFHHILMTSNMLHLQALQFHLLQN